MAGLIHSADFGTPCVYPKPQGLKFVVGLVLVSILDLLFLVRFLECPLICAEKAVRLNKQARWVLDLNDG
jgi:hypothetical protein